MGIVVQAVFSGTRLLAEIEIVVRHIQAVFKNFLQQLAVAVESGVEAGLKHLFRLRRRCAELKYFKRTKLGKQLVEKSEEALARRGLAIALAPLVLIVRPREIVEKFSLGDVGNVVLDFVFLERPGDACGLGDEFADVAAVGTE